MEIVQAGPNTAAYPMHPWMIDEIINWERGVAAEAAQTATQNKYKNFLAGPFNAWWQSYDAGRAEEPAPVVPEGFNAQMSFDGLAFDLIGSGHPCGPVPAFKKRVVIQSTPGLLPAGQMAGQLSTAEPFPGVALFTPIPLPSGRVFQRIA